MRCCVLPSRSVEIQSPMNGLGAAWTVGAATSMPSNASSATMNGNAHFMAILLGDWAPEREGAEGETVRLRFGRDIFAGPPLRPQSDDREGFDACSNDR